MRVSIARIRIIEHYSDRKATAVSQSNAALARDTLIFFGRLFFTICNMASIQDTVQRVLFVSGLFGLSQLSRISVTVPRFMISRWRVIYSSMLLCSVTGALCWVPVRYWRIRHNIDDEVIMKLIEILKTILLLEDFHIQLYRKVKSFGTPFYSFFAIALSILHCRRLEKCINTILKVNENFVDWSGRSVDVPRQFGLSIGICFAVYIVLHSPLFVIIDNYDDLKNEGYMVYIEFGALYLCYSIRDTYNVLIVYGMSTLAISVGSMLNGLNKELKKFLENITTTQENGSQLCHHSTEGFTMVSS